MKLNQRKTGAILSYLSIILNTFLTIFYTPIILRYLGDAEYGVYELTASLVAYLGLLSLGFGSSYIRFFYKYKIKDDDNGIKKLNGLFMIVFLTMSLISLILGFILIVKLDIILKGKLTREEIRLSKKLMSILIFNIALTFPTSVFESFISANEKFIFQRIIMLIRLFLSPILGIPLLMIGFKSVGLVIATSMISLFAFISNGYFAVKKLSMRFDFSKLDRNLLRAISVFSGFVFLSMMTEQINWSVDKFVLGKFVGSVSVTIYAMGSIIYRAYQQLSSSVVSVFVPQVNKMVASGENDFELTKLFAKISRVQLYILMLILLGFFAFGKYFISKIWLDDTYIESYYVAIILMTSSLLSLIQAIGVDIQRAKNLHKFMSVVFFIVAISNFIISIPLAIKFGPIGSAMGTALTVTIGNGIIMNIYYHKKIGIDIKYYFKEILSVMRGMIPSILLAYMFFKIEISNIYLFAIYVLLFTVSYLITIWIFSMNNFEKSLFLKPIKKIS
ncbi:lipopolysaccharide biosynthesis protein [Anaerococcus hydrogenalis]|uniref:Polysaccharide biosynthesis protein n=1 Tax=Anaerococcus hydrogenalis TaxID=33029 RepID=A0A2N6UJF5_9FIRM|nr:oligosaccharide flippase family protein [Anaerococcus hydrogenalis]MDK7695144.1 oligosaccharide flippase family protein [Anaerococcus hydrogenalis]MDK7696881.1 oligosaccharide flippase family protein [Anaerococcus hydrogenalis]MDK7708171.1 oligosaccharide flippase family protein [Anaerococcus hydrogenalis]PMC81877.1 polysaccharide biosynthesis protein [Anaerococcus hydrogenalis]